MRSSLPFLVSGLITLAVAQSVTSTAFPLAPTTLVTKTVDTATTNAPSTDSLGSVGGYTTLFQLVSANTPVFSSSAAPTVSVTHFDPSSQISTGPDVIDPHTMDGFSDGSSYHDVTENTPESHGAINYYFIFIGVAIGLLILGLWALYRRKRALKAIRRTHNRRNAATSDISSAWRGTVGSRRGRQGRSNSSRRRWMQRGAPWHNRPVDTEAPLVEREEGLNELGEAPPAYVKEIYGSMAPRITVASVRSLTPEDNTMLRPVVVIEGPAIPMRCLSSNERERPRTASSMGDKPPDYEEATSALNTPIPSSPPAFDSHPPQETRSSPT